jgi:hypothetical protein
VESERHDIENLLVHGLIIILKIEVQSLFVVHVEVVLDLVIEFYLSNLVSIFNCVAAVLLSHLELVVLACILLIRILLQLFILFR